MRYIDEKFKEAKPEDTVARIKQILDNLGIEVYEDWHDSGIENCYSLSLRAKGGVPSSNGKGITEDFARASAYGEFIERLQGGLFFYKFQSIGRDPDMNLHAFAPDAKYMSTEELVENGEWMDSIIDKYNFPSLDRNYIANQCKMYACADDGKVLTLPFYSLFEKKYVYLPIHFVDQIYATNGCCAGNTRDEAWVHALAEIMERHANLTIFTSGCSAPKISDDTIAKYPVVSRIIKQIRASGDFDVDLLDYSLGSGFPIVATRVIDKRSHSYGVKVAADPVFEIAMQRTLTELFQGRDLKNFISRHDGTILKKATDFSLISNVINQLETGNGRYTADYFANELTCEKAAESFADNTDKNNSQLLKYLLDIFKKAGKQIYVRNFSYLGFPSYRFIVPGFSEVYGVKLGEAIPEYSVADTVCSSLRNPTMSSNDDLAWLLTYSNMIKHTIGRYNYFGRISGLPISGQVNTFLAGITRAYASYRLKSYDNTVTYLKNILRIPLEHETSDYLHCIVKYVELKKIDIDENKIELIINKFFTKSTADKLFSALKNGKTPFDDLLLHCDFENCDGCKYREQCCYENSKKITKAIARVYSKFTDGQSATQFSVD